LIDFFWRTTTPQAMKSSYQPPRCIDRCKATDKACEWIRKETGKQRSRIISHLNLQPQTNVCLLRTFFGFCFASNLELLKMF
jgi:hypothetical protein